MLDYIHQQKYNKSSLIRLADNIKVLALKLLTDCEKLATTIFDDYQQVHHNHMKYYFFP
ncbi:hypothetical protein D3C72_2499740 [compost metagenome]